ncbi:hypothetical protein QJS04_geneDACA022925 [Acorus gramineus]|uniref:Aminotransferase-like plant mobile domain-containing protein n=1 Tax=Acorus gramineus TaxID=55184 RepID=A0AAV8ZWE0_ACOGR|nr:hypothetical protein QJS04_geneDACA022925 [Acorus gramineus]
MGISLDDVHQIVGIPVMGRGMSKPAIIKQEDVVKLVHRALHLNPKVIEAELGTHDGRSVRLSWLKDNLAKKTSSMPTHSIECVVQGYLLYLLSCTIFPNKTGTYVSVEYLQYLDDLDKVKEFAWGAATLVHLYHGLGMASRAKCKSISGYLTLLQIDFNPYLSTRDSYPLQEYSFFKGCLVANRISEPYLPDRYLRQLGHVQSIPREPIQPDGKTKRPRLASSYRVTYGSNVTQME